MSFSLTAVLAAICIIVGFVIALVEGSFLFPPLGWFVAAIALNTLGNPVTWRKGPQ